MFFLGIHQKMKKLLIFVLIFSLLLSLQAVTAFQSTVQAESDLSLDWDVQFKPYRTVQGQVVTDAAGDHGKLTSSMFDLVSNGNSAAVSYAFKNDQVYFRMNLKGDPRNENAGGFDNRFRAMIQILRDSGELVGAVGLNGSDKETDYLYVASFDSPSKTMDVAKVYEFPFSAESLQNAVRVLPDQANNSFFLDLQFSIYDIATQTGIDFENDALKFVYGTSMRGNLVEITKDSILNGNAAAATLAPISLQQDKLKLETNLVGIVQGSNPPVVDEVQEYVLEYKVTNIGMNDLKNVEVKDTLYQELEVITPPDRELDLQAPELTWQIAELDSLTSKSKRITVQFTPQSYDEGEPYSVSEFAYASIVDSGGTIFDPVATVLTKNVLGQRTISIGSETSNLASVVVSSASPVIRGMTDAAKGEKVKITLASEATSRTYYTEVNDGIWTLDLKKEKAPLLLNDTEYLLTVKIGASTSEQTIRHMNNATEYEWGFRDEYGLSTDAYVLTNDSFYEIRGWTTAPVGTLVTTSDGEISEVVDDPSSATYNMWAFNVDLNTYGDGTYLFDAYIEGQSSSNGMMNTVYANLLLTLDRTPPEIEPVNEDYFSLFSDQPLIRGFVSEPNVKLEVIVDLNADGIFAEGAPDAKYTPTLSGNEWEMKINQSLPRGQVTQVQFSAADAAGNSNQFLMGLQPSADAPYLNIEMPDKNTFTNNDIVISGTTNTESLELLVLKVTDRASDETFNYYTVVDNEQNITFSLFNLDITGDFLKDGEYDYAIEFINPKLADLKAVGTFNVQIPKPQFVMKNEVKQLNIQNSTLTLDGLIAAEDMEMFIGADVNLKLTNSANDTIGEQISTTIDESGAYLVEKKMQLPSGAYQISLELIDRAFNVFTVANAPTSVEIDVSPPTVPAGLSQQTVTKDSATLKWNASTDNKGIKEYAIYVDGNLKASVNGLNYTLTELAEFKGYNVQIAAVDVSGNSSPRTNTLKVKTLDRTAPTVPGGLKSSDMKDSGFRVAWSPSTDTGGSGVSAYEVYLDGVLKSASVTTPSFQFSALKPSTTYRVAVKAKDVAGNISIFSQSLIIVTSKDTVAPSKPGPVTSSNVKSDRFTIAWKASTDNAKVVGYEVYLNNKLFMKMQGASTTLTINGLKNFTKYAVKIRAYDAAGNFSLFTNEVLIATGDSVKPSVPTGLKIVNLDLRNIRISWNAAKDDSGVPSYEVFADGVRIGTTNKPVLDTKTPTKASVNYQVLAIDRYGNKSALSSVVAYKRKPTLEVRGKTVLVNGVTLKLPTNVAPVLRNGTMMIPYKQVFDALALKSSYRSANKTVTATRTGYTLSFTVGSRNYRVNKVTKTMTVAPVQLNGVVLLPAKFFETELGMRYGYSAK